jgi:hypothetical protein
VELDRNELIERLTRDYMNTAKSEDGSSFMEDLLNNGFTGLHNMPYSQLLKLAEDAELLGDDEEEEEGED